MLWLKPEIFMGLLNLLLLKNQAENKLSQIETKLQLQSYRNLNRVL